MKYSFYSVYYILILILHSFFYNGAVLQFLKRQGHHLHSRGYIQYLMNEATVEIIM